MPDRFLKRTACLASIAAALAVSACSPRIDNRGYVPDPELVSEIRVGVDNKKSVANMLGYPSSQSIFDDRTWYYISRRTKNFAFFDESLIDQSVLEVNFDDRDYVVALSTHGAEEVRDVELIKRETPTRGKELTFFEQLFGNMGRFNKNRPKQGQ